MKRVGHSGSECVEELQGLYGPYAFPERLLQKIWLLGRFETRAARLADGRRLEVLAPGRWNRLGGPDFREARLRIDGQEVAGDVEVHFHAADWRRHGHDDDPAYAGVVLHVVLFESRRDEPPARTSKGRTLPVLVLLPWLHCNLEEFAADDAVEALTQQDAVGLAERLLAHSPEERLAQVQAAAKVRWEQKVHFARLRVERLGWEAACHHTALEILGYRQNRAAMLGVAERYPLAAWREGLETAELLAAGDGRWCRQGVRPANSPSRRLEQYRAWVAAVPDWPARWAECSMPASPFGPDGFPELADIGAARRRLGLASWRERVAAEVLGGAVGGLRMHTLIGNGLFPLRAARTASSLFGCWYLGEAGEAPDSIRLALRVAGLVGRGIAPNHEGAVQGMLHLAWQSRDAGAIAAPSVNARRDIPG